MQAIKGWKDNALGMLKETTSKAQDNKHKDKKIIAIGALEETYPKREIKTTHGV